MAAGSIIIDLLMRTGSFETDSKRAEKALKELKKEAFDAGRAIGVALTGAALATAYAVQQQIEAADAAGKAAAAAGVAVDQYTALAYAAELSGVETVSLNTALRELNKSLAGNDKAFQTLGISVRDAGGQLKTADVALAEIADAFAKLPEGPKRAQLAIELFGKAGTDLIPLLSQGSAGIAQLTEEARRLGVVVDAETAKAAEEFNDNLSRLTKTGQGLALQLAKEVLPALNELSTRALKNARDFGLLRGSFVAFYETLLGGTEPADKLEEQSKITADSIKGLREEIAKLTAQGVGEQFQGGVLGQLRSRLAEEEQRAKRITQDLADALNAQAGRSTFGRGVGFVDPRLPKPAGPDDADKKQKALVSEAQRYLETLQRQSEETLNLTAYEKALLDIQKGRIEGLTPALERQILAQAKSNDLNRQALELRDAEVAVATARARIQLDNLESLEKGNQALRDEIALIGLDELGIVGVERARVSSTRALKEEELARKQAAGVADELLQALQSEIALLREREALLGEKIERGISQRSIDQARQTGDKASEALADSIEQGILDGFRSGQDLTTIFLNELKAQFAKTILRPVIQPVADAGNQLLGDILGAIGSAVFGGGGVGITAGNSPDSSTGETIRGRRARGGPVYAGAGEYIVGEEGPERFRPSSAGRIIPNGAAAGSDVRVEVMNNGQPVSARATSQQTDTGTLVRIVLDAVGADLASGTGPASRGLRARGVNLNAALARRG